MLITFLIILLIILLIIVIFVPLITNTYNGISGTGTDYLAWPQLPYIQIKATGTAGFTGLFGGQAGASGNIPLYPNSTWSYTSTRGAIPYSHTTNSNQHLLYLEDSGSGVPFEMVVVGVTGNGLGG